MNGRRSYAEVRARRNRIVAMVVLVSMVGSVLVSTLAAVLL
jgi:Na+-transporting NADH:ubiquinone oxidoreductase subunit NqrC